MHPLILLGIMLVLVLIVRWLTNPRRNSVGALSARSPEYLAGWRAAMDYIHRMTWMPEPWPDPPDLTKEEFDRRNREHNRLRGEDIDAARS